MQQLKNVSDCRQTKFDEATKEKDLKLKCVLSADTCKLKSWSALGI